MNRFARPYLRPLALVSLLTLAAPLCAQSLSPVADAHVQSGANQNTNFGTAATLATKISSSPTGNFNRESYLRFDLAGLPGIGSGKLRLYGSDQNAPESVAVEVRSSTNTTWIESGAGSITWANRPAAGATVHASAPIAKTSVWHEFDLTSFLQAEKAAGRDLVTLVLRSSVASTTGYPLFNSRENAANPPELLITADTTPPSVSLTAPARNQNIGGAAVALAATASDASGIAAVDFFDRGAPLGSSATAPYGITWDTTTAPNAVHLLSAAATDAAGNLGLSAEVPVIVNNLASTYLANKRGSPITIDGALGEAEWSTSFTAAKLVLGSTPNNTVTFGALWDATYLYVAVRVLDADLYQETGNHWDDDSVEVYLDANRNGASNPAYELAGAGNGYGFDRQFVKRYNDPALYSGTDHYTGGVLHAVADIPGGFAVEMAIPWANLNTTPAAGLAIGFDLGNNDDDDGGTRDRQAVWNGTVDNYNDTSGFGTLTLVEPGFHLIGAAQPWAYHEAEDGATNGTLATGTSWGQVAFEARGKKAVVLDAQNEYVEWTNVTAPGGQPATYATLRYSLPDLQTGALGLYVNGVWKADVPLTSVRMRETKSGSLPGNTVRFFDDVLVAVPGGIPAGATVTVRIDAAHPLVCTVDFLEVETAPAALTKPDETWLDITAYGAIADDGQNDRAAIEACLAAANTGSKKVWIPAGTFDVSGNGGATTGNGIVVPAGIQIRGAGMWHTRLNKNFAGQNARLFTLSGSHTIQDFKVVGSLTTLAGNGGNCVFRNDTDATTLERIWTEYTPLFVGYNCTNGTYRGNRIRNTYKDAMHIARASVGNLVEDNQIRNAGDDSIPFVSYNTSGMANNTARYNTAECGHWGRGITNLGGDGNRIEYNVVRDCVAAGLMCAVESYAGAVTPYCKNFVVAHNTVIRCGNQVNAAYGAAVSLWATQVDTPIFGRMENNTILAPPFHGAQLTGNLGDSDADAVYFRYNGIEAPVAGGTWVRKTTNLYAGNNCVHTPNTDL